MAAKKLKTLLVGEYHAAEAPTVIQTVLGSCVAVCLMDFERRIGGMNHILVPQSPDLNRFNMSARYGINAMELLINSIMKLGGDRHALKAKVFGGAHLFPNIPEEKSIGRLNAEFAMNFLKKEKIDILGFDVGGHATRKLVFHTDTGQAFVRRTYSVHYRKIASDEKRRFDQLKKSVKNLGDVTWFWENNFIGNTVKDEKR